MITSKVERRYKEDLHHTHTSHVYCIMAIPHHQLHPAPFASDPSTNPFAAQVILGSVISHCRYRGLGWYPRSHVSCQIHATRSIWDSRGKNYCPVATVTSHMQKTPCCGWRKWWFVRFDFEKPFQWWEGGRKGEREVWEWEKKKMKERDSNTFWGRRRKKRGKAWLAGTGSSALDNLGHFCHCISIRRAETPHLPFISFPFQHLQAICILSVLPPLLASFHFSACHYISWMITYWQFLHWHSTDQDTTLPASKAG